MIIFLTNSIYLIDKEADLDAKDMGGRTPLLWQKDTSEPITSYKSVKNDVAPLTKPLKISWWKGKKNNILVKGKKEKNQI